MTRTRALHVVRLSALYDLIVTVGFAFPFTAPWVFRSLAHWHGALGLSGTVPDAGDPFTVMFANLMGGLVTVWALFRLLRPSLAAGAADVGGRVFFSLGMAAALLAGASPLVWVMLVLEFVWAVVQAVAVFRASRVRA